MSPEDEGSGRALRRCSVMPLLDRQPQAIEPSTKNEDEGPAEAGETAGDWEERLFDIADLGCRITVFHALGESPRGLFRVMPITLRFLRLAAGRTQAAVGAALGVEAGTVEAIERGCVHPALADLDTWLRACESELADLFAAQRAAQAVWPPELATLTLPQFWGPLAPSRDDFETARRLIAGMAGGKLRDPETGSVPPEEVGNWLARFFAHLDEEVSPHLASIAPRAGLAELDGHEPVAVSRWWARTLALWFDLYLVCQAPVGCRLLAVEPDPGS